MDKLIIHAHSTVHCYGEDLRLCSFFFNFIFWEYKNKIWGDPAPRLEKQSFVDSKEEGIGIIKFQDVENVLIKIALTNIIVVRIIFISFFFNKKMTCIFYGK